MKSTMTTTTLLAIGAMVLVTASAFAQNCSANLVPVVKALRETSQTLAAANLASDKAKAQVAAAQSTVDEYNKAATQAKVDAANAALDNAKKEAADAEQTADAAKRAADLASNQMYGQLGWNENGTCLVAAILANPAFNQSIAARAKAAFQQNGSSNGTGGSTNIVSKGTAATVLSLADEYGALTESVSGQNVTVSGTLAGIPTLLVNSSLISPCLDKIPGRCISTETLNRWSRLSYSVAFAASQPSPQVSAASPASSSSSSPTTFGASYQSINAVTAKAIILRGASATPSGITKAIAALTIATVQVNASDKAVTDLQTDFGSNLANWQKAEINRLENADDATIAAASSSWSQSLPLYLCAGRQPCPLQAEAEAYAKAYFAFENLINTFVEGLRKTPVLSAEYDANLPASQTSNSTIRLIGAIPLGTSGITVTANGAVSFYNGTPSTTVPGARILRDFQLAAETAYTFGSGSPSFLGQSTLSAAYYYQDQTSPSILNVTPGQPVPGVTFTGLPSTATQVFAQRGVINLVQGKFNFIPGKGSINVPLSVTWSNRTELVTQKVWRTQIGISYDFDSLFSGLGK